MEGWIYILKNSVYGDIIKIGYTQRSPSERAKELSSATGVPGKFEVQYQLEVPQCEEAERQIHKKLEKYKDKSGKEFFNVSLETAKDAFINVAIGLIREHIDKLENELQDKISKYREMLIAEIKRNKKLLEKIAPKYKKKLFITAVRHAN